MSAKARVRPGLRPFFPELEPHVVSRLVFCAACKGDVVRHGHLSSQRHKEATRPIVGKVYNRRPDHLRDPYGDRRDWAAEAAEAGRYS